MKEWKIVQCSPPRSGGEGTGSTVLFNILYGLICPDEPVEGSGTSVDKRGKANDINKKIIITHKCNIATWVSQLKMYDLYFICSERGKNRISPSYRGRDDVLIFQFKELNETGAYTVEKIVDRVYEKVKNFLPSDVELDKDTAVKRILDMNNFYKNIKDKPFSYYDYFYHIHGSHRRKK